MIVNKILSNRLSNDKVYSDLIYEWEDDYAQSLGVEIFSYKKWKVDMLFWIGQFVYHCHLTKIIQFFDRLLNSKRSKTLVFTLYPSTIFDYRNSKDKIPFLIDFDYNVKLDRFFDVYRNCDLVIVSNNVAYDYLKANNCPFKIAHVPLSLKSSLKVVEELGDRQYDIFIARQNPVLMNYLKKYCIKHPSVEYVERKWESNQLYTGNAYYSNKSGRVGEFSNRDDYFKLIRNCKVAFYATSGIDSDQKRFMNHVTPSLLEYIVSGCKILARYEDNSDTSFFEFTKYFKNIQSYQDFENQLDLYLGGKQDFHLAKHREYMKKYGFESQFKLFCSAINNV